MTAYEIPLSTLPQSFTIDLGSKTYVLTVLWNDAMQVWTLDIAQQDGTPLLQCLPIVTGCDLLEQYGYLEFGGQLIAQVDHDPFAAPSLDNLGSTGHLYFVTA